MKIKKILSAALAAAMALSLCGCSVKVGTNKKVKDSAIVAQAKGEGYSGNEELRVTYGDFKKEYMYYLKSQGITDDSAEEVAQQCSERRATIINYLINEKIMLDKAKELGCGTLTSEEMDEVEAEYNEQIAEQVEYFGGAYDLGTSPTVEAGTAQSRSGDEIFDEYLADCGLTRDDLLMWQVNSAITNKVIEEVTKDISIEYSEAETEFNNIADSIKELYESDVYEYETGSGYTSLWLPEGARHIKHVLLSFDSDFITELRTCRQNNDDEGANRLREQKAEEMQAQTDEIINMLDNGADIDELIVEYSGDSSGSLVNPDGYVLVPNGESYMAEFQQAAFELENVGDYKTCVTDYGVHIVMYASDAKVSDEEVKEFTDYLYDTLTQNKKNEYFSELLNQWKKDYAFEIDYDAIKIDEPSESATEEAEG